MAELHTGPKHPLNGTDLEFFFDFHLLPIDTNQKESDCGCLAQYIQAYSGLVGLVDLGQLPT